MLYLRVIKGESKFVLKESKGQNGKDSSDFVFIPF